MIRRADDYINPNTGKRTTRWLCECDCNTKTRKIIYGRNLKSGKTKSCGCLLKRVSSMTHKKYNQYEVIGSIVKVFFINSEKYFICDLDDWIKNKQHCWSLGKKYAYTSKNDNDKIKTIFFHTNILERKNDCVVDHKNGNTLDNRKENLRVCSQQENMINQKNRIDNTSNHKGVYFDKTRNKWVATLTVKGKSVLHERYNNKESAITARERAEVEYFDQFNPINYRNKDLTKIELDQIVEYYKNIL